MALTIALCLRDDESRLADMAKAALEVAESLAAEYRAGEWRDTTREEAIFVRPRPWDDEHSSSSPNLAEGGFVRPRPWDDEHSSSSPNLAEGGFDEHEDLDFELLALDESSRDNTLSVLSILHARLPQLRTIQDIDRGMAVMQAARNAHGRVWLLIDAPFDVEHGRWAVRQVFLGDQAAMVPGEVLALRRSVGQAALGWHHGGLVGAQREVQRLLAAHQRRPAWSPPRDRSLRAEARRLLRGRFALLDRT